jgi:hypothetical protein
MDLPDSDLLVMALVLVAQEPSFVRQTEQKRIAQRTPECLAITDLLNFAEIAQTMIAMGEKTMVFEPGEEPILV